MKPPFRIQKIADEGSSEPYIARLWLGIFELRDFALKEKLCSNDIETARIDFDGVYHPILKEMDMRPENSTTRKVRKAVKYSLTGVAWNEEEKVHRRADSANTERSA